MNYGFKSPTNHIIHNNCIYIIMLKQGNSVGTSSSKLFNDDDDEDDVNDVIDNLSANDLMASSQKHLLNDYNHNSSNLSGLSSFNAQVASEYLQSKRKHGLPDISNNAISDSDEDDDSLQ